LGNLAVLKSTGPVVVALESFTTSSTPFQRAHSWRAAIAPYGRIR
jgi:hypothetical protein